jgi:DNA-binding NtrC family response regulator
VQFILAQLDAPNFTVTQAALDYLKRHSWPGNIRELRNTIERAMIEAKRQGTRTITRGHVQVIGSVSSQSSVALRIPAVADDISPEAYSLFISETERTYLETAIQLCNGNITLAAQKMGMNRATLYRKLSESDGLRKVTSETAPGLTTANHAGAQETSHAH